MEALSSVPFDSSYNVAPQQASQRAEWTYYSNNQLKQRIMEIRTGSFERFVSNYAIRQLKEELERLESINNKLLIINNDLEVEIDNFYGEIGEEAKTSNMEVKKHMWDRLVTLKRERHLGSEDMMRELSDQIAFLHQNNALLARANQLLQREVSDVRELNNTLNGFDKEYSPLGVRRIIKVESHNINLFPSAMKTAGVVLGVLGFFSSNMCALASGVAMVVVARNL